jgi:lysophospholipase L1-like esterase
MIKKIFLNSVLLFTSCTIALILAEGVLRIFAPQIIDLKINKQWLDEDRELGFVPKKNVHSRMVKPSQFDAVLNTNSIRVRGKSEYVINKPSDTIRILFLGDSFVFGWGVNDNETLPAQLEKTLTENGYHVEIINAGVYSYDTAHYYRWNRRFAALKPDLTILGYCLENDSIVSRLPPNNNAIIKKRNPARNNPFAINYIYYFIKENILLKSHLLKLIREQLYLHFPNIRSILFNFGLNDKRNIFLTEYPEYLSKEIELVTTNLNTLKNDVISFKGKLLILFVPLREQIYFANAINRFRSFDIMKPNMTLAEICKKNEIDYFDPIHSLTTESKKYKEHFYFQTDPHFSPLGNQVLAKDLFQFLIQRYPDKFRKASVL